MKSSRPLLIVVVVLMIAGFAFGKGGWISSGGEIFGYAKNPWFVKNTTDVDYCIQVDAASVSATDATVRDVVKDAIQYWKTEFSQQQTPTGTNGFAQLGTQAFHEVAQCSPATPLRLVFGYGALQPDEIAGLTDPTKYIGVTVRTDYNEQTLTGRGFVYISSDFGPHSYDAAPNMGHLLPRAWTERTLLTYAVLHEMGHVFGIPHMGSGLMSEVFLDQLLNKGFYQFYLDNPIISFLKPPLNFTSCAISGSLNISYFQVPPDTGCLTFEGVQNASQFTWKVFSRQSAKSPMTPAGKIIVNRLLQLDMGATPAVVIHLPAGQQVFSIAERVVNTFMIGPVFSEGTATGNFQSMTSTRPNDLQVELRTDSIVMTGIVSGRMVPVMVYRPPSLLNLALPVGP